MNPLLRKCIQLAILLGCLQSLDCGNIPNDMAKFENDMEKCFIAAQEQNSWLFKYPSDVAYKGYEAENLETFKTLFEFLGPIVSDDVLKNLLTSEKFKTLAPNKIKEEKVRIITQEVISLYAIGEAQRFDLPYHNFCHGVFVAQITYQFFKDQKENKTRFSGDLDKLKEIIKKQEKDAPSKEKQQLELLEQLTELIEGDDNEIDAKIRVYVFAAIGHDFGHPGKGNNIFKLSKVHLNEMLYALNKNIGKYFSTEDTVSLKNFIADAQDPLTAAKFNEKHEEDKEAREVYAKKIKEDEVPTNRTNGFFLEDLHAKITVWSYRRLTGKKNGDDELIIIKTIRSTIMGPPKAVSNIFEVAHAADIGLGGCLRFGLLYQGFVTVFNEFYREGTSYMDLVTNINEERFKIDKDELEKDNFFGKLYAFTKLNRPSMQERKSYSPWMNTVGLIKGDYGSLLSGQAGFNDFVVKPTFDSFSVAGSKMLEYLTQNIGTNSLMWKNFALSKTNSELIR